ncbi:hypothetical protein J6590_033086 [Homalodisca vitripennis]|nr:hypothetical protein J6590_033086 [Homalodisca vitripennis]
MLITTIEVLEADLGCMRLEIVRLEVGACPSDSHEPPHRHSVTAWTVINPQAFVPTPELDNEITDFKRDSLVPHSGSSEERLSALHSMADLLLTTKTHLQNSKIYVNIICKNFSVAFVEAHCWVLKRCSAGTAGILTENLKECVISMSQAKALCEAKYQVWAQKSVGDDLDKDNSDSGPEDEDHLCGIIELQ